MTHFQSFLNALAVFLAIYQLRCKRSRLMLQKKPLFLKKSYGPFLWMGFNCLNAIESLQWDSLLFTTKCPGVPGTRFINPGRMKDWANLEANQWFWTRDPLIVIQHLSHWVLASCPYPKVLGSKPNYKLGKAFGPNLNPRLWVIIVSYKIRAVKV